MLDFLWPMAKKKKMAQSLYRKAVLHARRPEFYDRMGVPDSVDGRFDMITLHVILIMLCLSHDSTGAKVNQALFDVMFQDMDKALREMAIGDLSVPKHMKRMMNGFNGRLQNYRQALEEDGALNEVLLRNVYGSAEDPSAAQVADMAEYVRHAYDFLKEAGSKKILDGTGDYPEL